MENKKKNPLATIILSVISTLWMYPVSYTHLKKLISPEGYSLLSIRDISEIFQELLVTGLWFLGICSIIFFLAGIFIWEMMRRTLRRMEELQEVAGKQEMLLGALSHEMKTPLTSIIGYSDTLRAVNLSGEQKDRALEHISREGRRLEALSAKMLQMLGLHRNNAIQKNPCSVQEIFRRIVPVSYTHLDVYKRQSKKDPG